MEKTLTESDVFTLIGHAEYLRRVHGQHDMPAFFDALAERIAMNHAPAMVESLRLAREARAKVAG